MKILALADRMPSRPIKEILKENPDIELIITLGDLYFHDIQELEDITDIPKIGVYGNHCDGMYMKTLGIQNLHLTSIVIGGISFFWYQGCLRYKESDLQSTQEVCQEAMREIPRYDVLISHCPPRGIDDNDDPSHIGFDWLKEYIERVSPKYAFHGHTYDDGRFIEKYKDTEIVYVYREKVVEITTP